MQGWDWAMETQLICVQHMVPIRIITIILRFDRRPEVPGRNEDAESLRLGISP